MPIHWFPGHMNRARREIAAALRKVDVVIELVDARLPIASRNPLLEELSSGKPVLTIMTRADLADPEVTRAWQTAWTEARLGPTPLALVMTERASVRRVPARCRELAPHRGGPGRTLRTMVVGIPNVGKSTLINTLCGRRIAKVGDKPAVTRKSQRVELESDFSIFDSPGVLWPRLDDQEAARRLAASGAIGEAAYDPIEVAGWAACFLATRYAALLDGRYGLEGEAERIVAATSSDPADSTRAVALLEAVGRRRGALRSGGHVDLERAADHLLRDLRGGKLGPISFERPEDHADYLSERRARSAPRTAPGAEEEREADRPEPPDDADSATASSSSSSAQ
ncbi:MAG: ribosome biogenesis GTPase YlqF [Spirochaetaceae bacterium]|nr:ribosome biogenesis GTPase YlqF [Spirochaetaceae bacterium]HPG24426.1 ribosome biogenesis GTPase YlqF [Myxococcota bacterium]